MQRGVVLILSHSLHSRRHHILIITQLHDNLERFAVITNKLLTRFFGLKEI